ncbi:hypothetical protein ACFFGR_02000 [Arthrobacter liuii]|uniref:DUF3846 domain-containing protein n=1 Tax=Arthrobacter liuii TaxID=1476996 RepID=A0ABQ2B1U4_9MICC|nr:hypothetical protein [Arthrobacter liuii]GGI01927.1 hypothetical protein GCM10007170_42490 [Arthrobacter liuii]
MTTSHHALVVPTRLTQPVHIRTIDLDETAFQKIASGGVGLLAGTDWQVYLDNRSNAMVTNPRAEVLIREAGVDVDGTIQGTALFLGRGNPDGECDAPRRLIRLAEQLFDLPLVVA